MHAHRVLGNQIRLVAPPLYVIVTNSLDKTIGIDVLEKAIVRIEEIIRTYGGGMTVKMKVYISALACVIRIKKFICIEFNDSHEQYQPPMMQNYSN